MKKIKKKKKHDEKSFLLLAIEAPCGDMRAKCVSFFIMIALSSLSLLPTRYWDILTSKIINRNVLFCYLIACEFIDWMNQFDKSNRKHGLKYVLQIFKNLFRLDLKKRKKKNIKRKSHL